MAGRGLCSAFLYFTCSLLQNFVTVLLLSFVEYLIQIVSVLHLFTESALFYSAFPIGRMLFCFNPPPYHPHRCLMLLICSVFVLEFSKGALYIRLCIQ